MKKQYMKPQIEVVNINHSEHLLAGSKYPKGYNGEFGAPEFTLDDDTQEI